MRSIVINYHMMIIYNSMCYRANMRHFGQTLMFFVIWQTPLYGIFRRRYSISEQMKIINELFDLNKNIYMMNY